MSLHTLLTPCLSIDTTNAAKLRIVVTIVNGSATPMNGKIEILQSGGPALSGTNFNGVAAGGLASDEFAGPFTSPFPETLVFAKITVDVAPQSLRANMLIADWQHNARVSVDAR